MDINNVGLYAIEAMPLFSKNVIQIIGMIHVKALPGTPKNSCKIREIVHHAIREADTYISQGIDAILIENMHDVPYLQAPSMGPEIVSAMTRVSCEIRKITPSSIPCGVQILACANKEALSVAKAAELQFIRCEGFVFSHVADEGWTNSCAANLLRYRKSIQAEEVAIFTDIKKKHASHAVTNDVNIADTAAAAEFFLSDGLVITGSETGSPVDIHDLQSVKTRTRLPVLIGSGVTLRNLYDYKDADALIVGSHFKKNGIWYEDLDSDKISAFMHEIGKLRSLQPSKL